MKLAMSVKTPAYDDIWVPPDLQEFGDRHKIRNFADATYRNGYLDGFRAAREAIVSSMLQNARKRVGSPQLD